jgi:hypothetical protein
MYFVHSDYVVHDSLALDSTALCFVVLQSNDNATSRCEIVMTTVLMQCSSIAQLGLQHSNIP